MSMNDFRKIIKEVELACPDYNSIECRTTKDFEWVYQFRKGYFHAIERLNAKLEGKMTIDEIEKHGLLPLSNKRGYFCLKCNYELKDNENTCPHNQAIQQAKERAREEFGV